MLFVKPILLGTALFAASIVAHPGHDLATEIAERSEFLKHNKRDLYHCASKLKARGHEEKALQRRQVAIDNARVRNGLLPKRHLHVRDDLDDILNKTHLSDLSVTATTQAGGLFGVEDVIFSNSSCVLQPEGEIGPYYVTGEYIRKDIRESQDGVDLILDAQFIDVDTCEPVPGLYWDIWHCNATGVYGGIVGSGNGNSDDASNINSTFLRGLQPTDADGVAQFITVFPGHYSGRATHIHVVAHQGGSVLSNGTYSGGNVTHIGQLFVDQDLITEVNKLEPYIDNTIEITLNADDRVIAAEGDSGADPLINYVLLGDSVADGLFGWIAIGVSTSTSYAATAAANYGADGGEAVSSSSTTTGGNGTEANSTLSGATPA